MGFWKDTTVHSPSFQRQRREGAPAFGEMEQKYSFPFFPARKPYIISRTKTRGLLKGESLGLAGKGAGGLRNAMVGNHLGFRLPHTFPTWS